MRDKRTPKDACGEAIRATISVACVASVSNRVTARKLEREHKKRGGRGRGRGREEEGGRGREGSFIPRKRLLRRLQSQMYFVLFFALPW